MIAALVTVQTTPPTHATQARRWWALVCILVGGAGVAYLKTGLGPTWPNIHAGSLTGLVWLIRALSIALLGGWVAWRLPWQPTDLHTRWVGFALNVICLLLLIPVVGPLVLEPKPVAALAYYGTSTIGLIQIIALSRCGFVRLGAALLTGNLVLQIIGLAGLTSDLARSGGPLVYCVLMLVAGLLVHWSLALVIALVLPPVMLLLGTLGLVPAPFSSHDVAAYILVLGAAAGIIALYTWSLDHAQQQYHALVRAHAHVVAHAQRDPLTGLFHRGALAELAAQSTVEQQTVGVLMLDIDYFKQVNDTYGHAAGDQVLQEVAATLQDALRSDDWACRYGGEEFVVLLPAITPAVLLTRAQALCQRIGERPIVYHEHCITVTVSIGAAHYPTHGATVLATLEAADVALYQAKRHGRNQVVVVGAARR